MKMAAFKAHCPYEIGDEIKTRRRISPEEAEAFHIDPETVVKEVHTITDIVCIHSVKDMAVGFLFELDGDTKKLARLADFY